MQHQKEPAQLTPGLGGNSPIDVRLVLPPICDYPTCSELTPNGVVITCVRREHREHRNYCCELHAAFALLDMARNEVMGYYTEAKANEYILQLAARSLAGEPITNTRQEDIDREVDRILNS